MRLLALFCSATVAAALTPVVSFAQYNQVPIVSTSMGGIVSGTYGYFKYVSATNIAVNASSTSLPVGTLSIYNDSVGGPEPYGTSDTLVTARFQNAGMALDIGHNNDYVAWLQNRYYNNNATRGNIALNPLGGNVGIGTPSPTVALEVKSISARYGILNSDGVVQLGTYLNDTTGIGNLGTKSNHKLGFFTNDGGTAVVLDTTGKVGVGTVSPSSPLTVSATGLGVEQTNGTVRLGTFVNTTAGYLGTVTSHPLIFYTSNTNVFTIGANGDVGIMTSPVAGTRLNVLSSSNYTTYSVNSASGGGGVALAGYNSNTGAIGGAGWGGYGIWCGAGTCGGASSWNVSSDARLKDRIENLPSNWGLAVIEKLRPVTYHWRDVKRDKREGEQIGFIAQEVSPVLPALVSQAKGTSTTITLTGNKTAHIQDPMSIKYDLLAVPLVKAVQELKAENDNLRSDHAALQALKADNDDLRREVELLKQQVRAMNERGATAHGGQR